VHLHEELVERVLALVVAAHHHAFAAAPPDGVDLVDEDDARRFFLRLLEQVAHARRAHADEHLDEVGAGEREERRARLARHRFGEQRLAGSRRADEQHALGQLAAELGKLLRVLEKIDDFDDFLFGFVEARHVFEGDLLLAHRVEQHRLVLADVEHLRARIHAPQQEDPQQHDQPQRDDPRQQAAEPVLFIPGRKLDGRSLIFRRLGVVFAQVGDEVVLDGLGGDEDVALHRVAQQILPRLAKLHLARLQPGFRVGAFDAPVVDNFYMLYIAFIYIAQKRAVFDGIGIHALPEEKDLDEQDQENRQIDPQREARALLQARPPLVIPRVLGVSRVIYVVALVLRHEITPLILFTCYPVVAPASDFAPMKRASGLPSSTMPNAVTTTHGSGAYA